MTTKITLAVTVLLACSLLTLSAAALDKASYEQLYLTAQDLPGLEKRADDTYGGPIPTTVTEAFEAVGGTFAGRVQWYHPHTDEVVWSVMDMRYVFPDERTAQSFIDRRGGRGGLRWRVRRRGAKTRSSSAATPHTISRVSWSTCATSS